MGLRSGARLILGVALVCGCGATPRTSDQVLERASHEAGEGGGVSVPDERPTSIEGVPIGDCHPPTRESKIAAGCPEDPPINGTACEAVGTVKKCPYAIRVADGEAKQLVSICHPEQLTWGSSEVSCGLVCPDLGPYVLELSQTPRCAARAETACRSRDVLFGFETEQQWLDTAFGRAISRCTSGARHGTRYLLELKNGCPLRLSSADPLPPDVSACVAAQLSAVRWDCGKSLACGRHLVPIPLTSP